MAKKNVKEMDTVEEKVMNTLEKATTFNPLLSALRENDKKNLFATNVTTAFLKTGFHLFDYYFGSVVNVHDELGDIIEQQPRIGQAAGTFNLLIGASASGKALAADEPIPTPSGWTMIRDIKIGDKVFNEHGKATEVVGVFPQGNKDLFYVITFADDTQVQCDDGHLWGVYDNNDNYQVLSTTDIIDNLNDNPDLVYSIPCLSKPIETECVEKNEIDPSVPLEKMIITSDVLKESIEYRENMLALCIEKWFKMETDKDICYMQYNCKDLVTIWALTELAQSLAYRPIAIDNTIRLPYDPTAKKLVRNTRLQIKDIMLYDCESEFICIKVANESGLFLTNDFIVTHNTTMAVQLAANIIRQFPYGNVIHYDAEQRMDVSRLENLTQLPVSDFHSDGRYILKSGLIGMDTIQEMVVKLYAAKVQNAKELTIDTGYVDEFNQPVKILQPTVIIIDSITSVISETFSPDNAKELASAEQLQSNTEGARSAKTIKGFFKDILPLCKDANIIIYAVNHINMNMSMNSFIQPTKQQNYLKQDESIPGGRTLLYYPFNIIKLTAKPSDDFKEDKDGFAGHIVMVEPIKSSSNQSGNNSKGISFELVFSFKNGFDALRSIILYGYSRGLIEGNRSRYKFKGKDYVFTLKNIHEEAKKFPIWEDIKEIIIPTLREHLPFIEHISYDSRSMDY